MTDPRQLSWAFMRPTKSSIVGQQTFCLDNLLIFVPILCRFQASCKAIKAFIFHSWSIKELRTLDSLFFLLLLFIYLFFSLFFYKDIFVLLKKIQDYFYFLRNKRDILQFFFDNLRHIDAIFCSRKNCKLSVHNSKAFLNYREKRE